MKSLVISLTNCSYSKFLCTFPLNSFIDELSGLTNVSVQLSQQTRSTRFSRGSLPDWYAEACSVKNCRAKTVQTNGRLPPFMANQPDESWLPLWSLSSSYSQRTYQANSSPTSRPWQVLFLFPGMVPAPPPQQRSHSLRQSHDLLQGLTQLSLPLSLFPSLITT